MIEIDNITAVEKLFFFFNQIKIYDYEMSLNTKFYEKILFGKYGKINYCYYCYVLVYN